MDTRLHILPLALLAGLSAAAQPTLTEANNAPIPGDVHALSRSTADSILTSAGPNETYGCWMLLESSTRDMRMLTPSETPTSGIMTGCEVLSTDGGTDTLFWSSDAAGLQLVGERTALATFPYTDAVKELAYPLTYNSTWTDAGSASYTVAGLSVLRTVSITGNADGYGTLELPAVEIDDVLRVRVRKVTLDQGGIANIERRTNITSFYTDTVRYPVLRLLVDSVSISGGAWSVTYSNDWMYGQGDVGLAEAEVAPVFFTGFPNPATDVLYLPVAVEREALCEVFDAAGRVVLGRVLQAASLHTVPVEGLPAGLYTVRITDGDGIRTGRFQVAR
jgi:hypothetical protein